MATIRPLPRFVRVLAALALAGVVAEAITIDDIDRVVAQGPYSEDWRSFRRFRVPQWYRDAKLGIFVHWGVYSVPAFGSEWYPRNMYQLGSREFHHHVSQWSRQSAFGYKDFIPLFRGERFDAGEWARLFRRAGARYVVPVAEHHDGFSMFNSTVSPWNAARMGPRRDVLGELARSVRAQGLAFAASSHRAEHWWYYDGGTQFDSDVRTREWADLYGPAQPRDRAPPDEAHMADWLLRTADLVEQHRPSALWFDWWVGVFPQWQPYLAKLGAFYYNRAAQWGADVLINYKDGAFPDYAGVFDVERGQLCGINASYWQTCTSVSTLSWGYIDGDRYKTPHELLGNFIDIVSKNGNLLMNVGPKYDGTIPQAAADILREFGRWMDVNGEAVHSSHPFHVFGEGPTIPACGSFSDTDHGDFTSSDWRFTTRNGTLYAIQMAWPSDGWSTITTLGRASPVAGVPSSVRLLGTDERVAWKLTDQGLVISTPAQGNLTHMFTYAIDGLQDIVWDGVTRQGQDASFTLRADAAAMAPTLQLAVLVKGSDKRVSITNWTDCTRNATWTLRVHQPGKFSVRALVYSTGDSAVSVSLSEDGASVGDLQIVIDSGSWFSDIEVGVVALAKGDTKLVMHGSDPDKWGSVVVASLTLEPLF
eukprot:m51a1_g1773 putative alpha-l-fucosidase (648) ;mRNA; r:320014-322048